jgi:flavin reductase
MNQEVFHNAMSRLGAAVHLITTDGPAGRHGFTASAVCSVTDQPPTILVCINRASGSYQRFKENGILCVNILAGRHQALSSRFAGKTAAEERFTEGTWTRLATGAPVLEDAAAVLDCRIASIAEIGTHSVFFCEVLDIALAATPEGLIYFNRAYHPL